MASTSKSSHGSQLALVVQPDPELRGSLTRALEESGVEVLTAEEPREVLDLMDRHPVGALVIDAQLTSTSGFDLVRSLRQQARGAAAPIVIITNVRWSSFQKAAALHQMGLLDLLVKPVEPAHVAELVVGALTSEPMSSQWQRDTLVQPTIQSPTGGEGFRRTEADADEGDTRVERGDDRLDADEHSRPTRPGADATDVGPPPAPDSSEPLPATDPGGLADPASHSEKRQVERATRAAKAGPAELRGNLTRVPFPQLLHTLYLKRATGALFLLNDRIKKIVYFKEGHPSYIKSNRLSECLGKILVREGMITEAQCRDSLGRMAATTRQQGTVLIEMGVISPHELVVGLERQLRLKLMDIFNWSRGEYLFRRENKVPSDVITLDVSNATLIADGVRATWDEARLDQTLAPRLERYVAPNSSAEMRFQELTLDPQEQELLDHIDGTRTLRQVIATSPLPARRAKAVAYVLLVTDVVQLLEHPLEQEAETSDPSSSPESGGSLRGRLAAELLALRQRDAFGILGVSRRCSDREVKEAHARAARDFHPDRYRHLAGETGRLAQEMFQLVNDAYARIATSRLRRQYREQGGTTTLPDDGAGKVVLEAERARRQARDLMNRGQWPEARQLLAGAVELCPDASDLRSLLAWSTYRTAPDSGSVIRTAIRELRHAIDLEPRRHEPYLFLGRIYAGMGKTIMAEKQFEKALQCDPDCNEALDELKIQKEKRPPRRYRF